MKTPLTLLFCLLCVVASASAQKQYCFENDGLKDRLKVSLTITQNKVEGTFEKSGYEETNSAETFAFTGTKTGNLLTIKFDAGKTPYQTAPRTRRIVWTLGAKVLKIPIYEKNYDTGKYSTNADSFDECSENKEKKESKR